MPIYYWLIFCLSISSHYVSHAGDNDVEQIGVKDVSSILTFQFLIDVS